MKSKLKQLVEVFARQRGVELPPDWDANTQNDEPDDASAIYALADAAGWKEPTEVTGRPRPNQFPLLIHSPSRGWGIADQWESTETLRVYSGEKNERWEYRSGVRFFELALPRSVEREDVPSALSVFWRSLLLRKKVFLSAVVATIVINLVTLATSLYSMQVYDRVIPRSGFSTLWVLTAGVLFALLIDFALRTTRSLMIEREAAKIDAEVSEFFFARAQAVRLDARPGGIGTMAAQLRGLEQVRSLLSSASIFLIADLPFALFFIFVIASLAGIVAIVPIISFPVALIMAFTIARLIRKDTAKAQVSGNRKNGLLVESLDAVETVKANRGGWHMLSRWNTLMDELQLHEDPVKRWQAIAGSIFSSLQQIAYVAIIALGAIQVSDGKMTMGALIACAIIAGRINGPLVSQLPNFLIQWGYARSSLSMLDAILALPLDRPTDMEPLRPEKLDGPIRLENVQFAYAGARSGLHIPHLEIKPGERVAIIGGIGSGKSTLLRVLAGLYAPAQGSVTIGGLDMHHVAEDILRQHVGYLPQDTRMLNGTLRDNILLGMANPGDDELMRVAGDLGLAPMIAGHPMGLDLPISEGGRGLSGGQRTLSGLTRLMLGKPRVMLLDEPTSNLDQATESRVLGALKSGLDSDSTLVLVTHRLQLLSLVDRVIVVTNGQVRLDGPPKEVLEKLRGNTADKKQVTQQKRQRVTATKTGETTVVRRSPAASGNGGGAADTPAPDTPAPDRAASGHVHAGQNAGNTAQAGDDASASPKPGPSVKPGAGDTPPSGY
ncbi:ATP-binding cassette domain-containing protein [Croceicoccus sp. YJ47]|uniref:ATP-binding cassette domain-containing protein n=1 Tax=Croceicoccus sp. YJ47 TaxID=2798724 RepID=UPI00192425DC|nr:ATP-binding cassette domain-containing protein [Croceicoccus sp. YJ47]QQN75453.1 ATP-binding cassette domain-containing protein [Croceicoccus sp. YJ47]